ncbi:uncharacterized protein LOC121648587 [Melanotaenia boesemani]|uniref:uncharacterized protein LOC121628760 n=1 Tax=Melanotaenia boesemani TaxID=1250792 RepID=UPI001C046F86|nr:uncharacterized protein LOC121628760 [Melanotaenia boesemani]XP_041824156.1 uncharacterized protein LOC121628841 [Melanotaenia boesemani]XP_041833666.1 uncharacterized protein LOC121634807 [Melanotaenia boesemani]XP_041854287.1 uncharacterized protein LOC121648328 [Melanotaenia boesemani]XP_041854726.1 uncharacterized protein LOC121648587 [Melanotaenia boesemani]
MHKVPTRHACYCRPWDSQTKGHCQRRISTLFPDQLLVRHLKRKICHRQSNVLPHSDRIQRSRAHSTHIGTRWKHPRRRRQPTPLNRRTQRNHRGGCHTNTTVTNKRTGSAQQEGISRPNTAARQAIPQNKMNSIHGQRGPHAHRHFPTHQLTVQNHSMQRSRQRRQAHATTHNIITSSRTGREREDRTHDIRIIRTRVSQNPNRSLRRK